MPHRMIRRRGHLPFTTPKEAVFRFLSMYLLAQYFRSQRGAAADWEMKMLGKVFDDIRVLNRSFCRRLSSTGIQDASINAVVGLDSLADFASQTLAQMRLRDGKMGIPDSVLCKPGPLSDEEREVVRQHPTYAYVMLSPIKFLEPALDIPFCHHEKWDGSGYPRGLRGDEIPLAARLFAVVDTWDALCSDRPYKKSWPPERARQHIASLAGSDFDPAVVKVFLELIGPRCAELKATGDAAEHSSRLASSSGR